MADTKRAKRTTRNTKGAKLAKGTTRNTKGAKGTKAAKRTTGNTKKAKAAKATAGNTKKAKAAKATAGNTKKAKAAKATAGNTKGAKLAKGTRKNTKKAKETTKNTKGAKVRARNAKVAKSTKKAKGTTKEPSRLQAVGTAIRGTIASAVATITGAASSPTDAIALLEADHRRMEELLERGEESTERAVQGRIQLLDTLTAELSMHEMIEEQILYPALERHPEAKDIVLEGFQEHHVADLIVRELHEVAADNEQWGAKFKVLKENLEHHIEEEEGEMFRTARAIFSQEELKAMGEEMAAMKAQARPA